MADATPPRSCPACAAAVTAEAAFCSQCGQMLIAASTPRPASSMKWYYNMWFVLFMLFFVLGPLGLPLVWKHPRCARWVKWTLTLAMVVYTMLLVQMTVTMAHVVTQHLQQFQSSVTF